MRRGTIGAMSGATVAALAAADIGFAPTALAGERTIPDRVSINPDSPHFWPHFAKLGVRIDGQNRPGDVHEFCVSEGWAMTRARNEKGQFKIHPSGSGFVLWKTVGVIEPFFKTEPAPHVAQALDFARMEAAEAKRKRKAEALRKQMGDG